MLACEERLASDQAQDALRQTTFCSSDRRLQLQNSAKGDAGFSNQGGAFHFGSSIRVNPRETAGYLSASKRTNPGSGWLIFNGVVLQRDPGKQDPPSWRK